MISREGRWEREREGREGKRKGEGREAKERKGMGAYLDLSYHIYVKKRLNSIMTYKVKKTSNEW